MRLAAIVLMIQKQRIFRISLMLFCLFGQFNIYALAQATPLSLPEAEHFAIENAPELQRLRANSSALEEQSVADGQLSDPQLIVGVANVPTNSFSFTQDDMTMVNVGLQQSFPRGHSLAIKSKQTKALANAEQRKVQEQAVMLLRNVRETWLDLYYWVRVKQVINENRSLYQHLFKGTESQYSLGKASQSEVLQLRLELSRLDDQYAQTEQRIDVLRAQLGRWVGAEQANRSLTQSLPNWPNPPSISAMKTQLEQHPLLKVDTANIEAARDQLAYAKEQYKPGVVVDVGYGIRQGTFSDGSGMKRSNFAAAQVTVDLPFFTSNRQDRSAQASAYQLEASALDRDIHYKDLTKELMEKYAIWRGLSQRDNLYHKKILPESIQNSKAAVLAYKNATTDLSTVLRAYSNNLSIQLEQLQIQVERAKTRAALLYLEGVS